MQPDLALLGNLTELIHWCHIVMEIMLFVSRHRSTAICNLFMLNMVSTKCQSYLALLATAQSIFLTEKEARRLISNTKMDVMQNSDSSQTAILCKKYVHICRASNSIRWQKEIPIQQVWFSRSNEIAWKKIGWKKINIGEVICSCFHVCKVTFHLVEWIALNQIKCWKRLLQKLCSPLPQFSLSR